MRLCFATGNSHKLEEVRQLVTGPIEIIGLDELDFQGDIPEDFETMEENSRQKAMFIHDRYDIQCFSDDSGLEVKALHGAPGVYSARYAGPHCSSQDNIDKLLKVMEGIKHREARFRAVISLVIDDDVVQFEGIVEGRILTEMRGDDGFGYDPVFVPAGYDQSFAEMRSEEKNKISHRGQAIRQLVNYLEQNL